MSHAMNGASVLLVLVSLAVAFLGLVTMTQATMGATLMALAVLVAVLARLNQAGAHHREHRAWASKATKD